MLFDPVITLVSQVLLFGLFLYSAWQKFSDLSAFRDVLQNYGLARGVLPVFAFLIPVLEISVSIGALISLFVPMVLPMVGGFALLTFYTSVLLFFFITGRNVDCGCHFGESGEPVNGWHIARNIILLFIALAYYLPQAERTLYWVDYFTAIVGVTMILLSLMIIETLKANNNYFSPVRGRN